jgi:hypothetical protein
MSKLACQTDLNKIICLGCPVPGFISQMSCQGCPATVIPGRWPCYNCPVLDVTWPSGHLFSVLSYYHDCPFFLSVLSLLSGPSSPVAAVLPRHSCPQLSFHDVMSQSFCPPWPVQADLSGRSVKTDPSRMSYPSCSVPEVRQNQYTCTQKSVLYRYKCMFFLKHYRSKIFFIIH